MVFPDTAKFIKSQIPQIFDKVSPIHIPPKDDKTREMNKVDPFAKVFRPKISVDTNPEPILRVITPPEPSGITRSTQTFVPPAPKPRPVEPVPE